MRRGTVPIVALFVVTLLAVGSTISREENPPDTMAEIVAQEMKRIVAEQLAGPQPDTESESWRQLTDDIGMVVARDD